MAEPRNRYSTVSLVLHWLIAALVVTKSGLIRAYEVTDGSISQEFALKQHVIDRDNVLHWMIPWIPRP